MYRTNQSGNALIWALLFVVIASGMVVSHSIFMVSERRDVDVRHRQRALAHTFAQSGLRDATAWFRAQESQPVELFGPLRDESVMPPILDTLDPTIGLVREFEISGTLWGRYEVRKDGTHDISRLRGEAQAGRVWDVGSRSYLFRRNDATLPFNQVPNRVVAITALRTELRSVPLRTPVDAAVIVSDPNRLSIQDYAAIDGKDAPGAVYPAEIVMTSPSLTSGTGQLVGVPAVTPVPGLDTSPEAILAMGIDAFRSFSDIVVSEGDEVPAYIPDHSVVFVDGDLTLEADDRLAGRMLLVVNGSLTANSGSYSAIDGLAYVLGDFIVRGRLRLGGSVISNGSVTLGGGSESVSVEFDATTMTALKTAVAAYRMSRSVRPESVRVDGAPPGVGTGTVINEAATVDERASVGDGVQIDADADIKKDVTIGDRVRIERGVKVNKDTIIAEDAIIEQDAYIKMAANIGADVRIGAGATIGVGAVIGAGATITPGASVPNGAVIPAGATF